MPPLFAHKDQRKYRQRQCKIDKGKSDPGTLEANLGAQLDGVESDAEAKDLTAEVEQRANLGCLLSVALFFYVRMIDREAWRNKERR